MCIYEVTVINWKPTAEILPVAFVKVPALYCVQDKFAFLQCLKYSCIVCQYISYIHLLWMLICYICQQFKQPIS